MGSERAEMADEEVGRASWYGLRVRGLKLCPVVHKLLNIII